MRSEREREGGIVGRHSRETQTLRYITEIQVCYRRAGVLERGEIIGKERGGVRISIL